MKKQNNKMKVKKKTTVFAMAIMLICFSVVVSASIYSQLDIRRIVSGSGVQCCEIVNPDSLTGSEIDVLRNKFEYSYKVDGSPDDYWMCRGPSNCVMRLDYFEFEDNTLNVLNNVVDINNPDYQAFYSRYGEIRYILDGFDRNIVMLGRNSSALADIVDLVADYNNHDSTLRANYAIFSNNYYFDLYEQGYTFREPTADEWTNPFNCNDQPGANRFVSNAATFAGGSMTSYCEGNTLVYPYCYDYNYHSVFGTETYYCDCQIDRCIADISDVFYHISHSDDTENFPESLIRDVISSWHNK